MAGEQRRRQIVREAMRVFSRRGFRGTTTKEIAQAAGVSEAMVFRHFATKEELYSAIIDDKACSGDAEDPRQVVADALEQKNDRAVFERLALNALVRNECDPEFQRLLLHSALEDHELAHMFWEKFVRRVYEFLGDYIRERQRDCAMIKIEPAIIVRAFIGMVIHHWLNNNLWDRKRALLKISNEAAARNFTDILLQGITTDRRKGNQERPRQNSEIKSRAKKARVTLKNTVKTRTNSTSAGRDGKRNRK